MDQSDELPLNLPAPEVSPEEVAMLVAVLDHVGDWITAKEIARSMGEGMTDRKVRAIASAARPAVVSFPGSKGYKLWRLCTIGEILHCIEAIESQGKDMLKGAVLYRQAYHARFRGAPENNR